MKRIIYTISFGFSLGVFSFYFLNYINNQYSENANNNRQNKSSSINGVVFLRNTQKNISEDDGEFFTPSPHAEESVVEDELQNI